ncbi:MAG TPA: hypothetical protein VF743_08860, partial [Acidimicrobiales bacterium]
DLGPAAPAFAVVLCAFNTFFNLTSTDDQGRCLAAVAGRLAPGGRLVVEAFVPPPGDGDGPDGGDGPGDGTGVVAGPVSSVEARHIGLDDVVLTVSRLDPATRTITGQHVQLSEAGVRLRPWVLHYASPDQLDALAAGAGLALVERHAGWRGEPFGPSSRTHVSVYGPAAGGGGAP